MGVGVALRQQAGFASAGYRHLARMGFTIFGGGRLGDDRNDRRFASLPSWIRCGLSSWAGMGWMGWLADCICGPMLI